MILPSISFLSVRALWCAVAVAIAVRVAVFAALIWYPVTDEQGLPVSPLHAETVTDYRHYLYAAYVYFGEEGIGERFGGSDPEHFGAETLVERFELYKRYVWGGEKLNMFAAPLFPALISLFDYRPGNSLPLALVFLVFGTVLVVLWLAWLDSMGVGLFWLIVFAVLPLPVWYIVKLGSDLPFALFFAIFFVLYFRENQTRVGVGIWSVSLLLLTLTRPSAVSVLAFVVLDITILNREDGWTKMRFRHGIAAAILAVVAVPIFLPYAISFVSNALSLQYFGISELDYRAGLFESLPPLVDAGVSWLSLLSAKLLYLCGLRPSYSGIETWKLLLRAAPGILYLPGLVYVVSQGDMRHRVLIALIAIPSFMGAAQERYMLPIQPLLFFYGVLFCSRVYSTAVRHASEFRRTPS